MGQEHFFSAWFLYGLPERERSSEDDAEGPDAAAEPEGSDRERPRGTVETRAGRSRSRG